MKMNFLFLIALIFGLVPAIQSRAELTGAKTYEARQKAVDKYYWPGSPDFSLDLEKFEAGSKSLIKDFPNQSGGYENLQALIGAYEKKELTKALALAKDLAADNTPERFRLWAKGCIKRLNSIGKTIRLQFVAVDGQEVDTAKLKGKVVLIDFWATTCSPCVRDLPQIKALYEKYHGQDFEVIGISCDSSQQTGREKFLEFIKKMEISWPQFYDGKQQTENTFAQEYGVDGIPHLLLIDKKGNLRFDRLHLKDEIEKTITDLLAE